ncbi:hypothetical protein ACOSQ2_032771 [Xanthoceras sorbifolium]
MHNLIQNLARVIDMMEARHREDLDEVVSRSDSGLGRKIREEIDLNPSVGMRARRTAGVTRSSEEREEYIPELEDG